MRIDIQGIESAGLLLRRIEIYPRPFLPHTGPSADSLPLNHPKAPDIVSVESPPAVAREMYVAHGLTYDKQPMSRAPTLLRKDPVDDTLFQ